MISFRLTEEEQPFKEMARSFAIETIRPVARDCEENREVSEEIVQKITELGFSALELPESWDGLELPLITQAIIYQSLSYGDLGVVQGLPGPGDAASLIRLVPDHPVLQAYKNAGKDGVWPDVAFIDATNAEDPWTSGLQIKKDGNAYIVDGTSQPVRLAKNAQYVAIAGVDSEGEHVILWLDKNGWTAVEGDYRLGLLAAGLGRIQFSNVNAGANQIIAQGSEAKELIEKVLNRIYVLQAAKEVGIMEAAVDYTVEYTANRKAFGQEIAKFQGVSFTVADMEFEKQAANHLVWLAATSVEAGKKDATNNALRAIYRAHRAARFVTDNAVQMLGGHGFVQEFPVEKWMRDAQAQVALYGRERDYLIRLGENVMNPAKKEAVR